MPHQFKQNLKLNLTCLYKLLALIDFVSITVFSRPNIGIASYLLANNRITFICIPLHLDFIHLTQIHQFIWIERLDMYQFCFYFRVSKLSKSKFFSSCSCHQSNFFDNPWVLTCQFGHLYQGNKSYFYKKYLSIT